MPLLSLSSEHKQIMASRKCPQCGAKLTTRWGSRMRVFREDGREIEMPSKVTDMFSLSYYKTMIDLWQVVLAKDRNALGACPECDFRWPIQEAAEPPPPQKTGIVETHRSMEPMGVEERIIDNSSSSVGMSRKISISRDWIQTLKTGEESASTSGGQLGIDLVNLKLSAEKTVRSTYETTTTTQRTYQDELTLDIPANTRVRLLLQWKRIWQHGYVTFQGGAAEAEVKVPYQVMVGVTFDQSVEDMGG